MSARGTPEEIATATLACIEANQASMIVYQKKMELLETLPQTEQTRKEYKSAFEAYHRYRIENLELKGEIPKRKEKQRKIRW